MNNKGAGGGRRDWLILGAAVAVLAGLLAYHHSMTVPGGALRNRAENLVRAWVAVWPEEPRRMAALMMERFGPPDRRSPKTLAWHARSPWKRIAVHRSPAEAPLEQTISYDVPPLKIAPLLIFGRGLSVNPDSWELSARAESEAMIFLKLNLADDIAQGRMSAEEAEAFYQNALRLKAAGKSSPYTEGLRFRAASTDAPPFAYRTLY